MIVIEMKWNNPSVSHFMLSSYSNVNIGLIKENREDEYYKLV